MDEDRTATGRLNFRVGEAHMAFVKGYTRVEPYCHEIGIEIEDCVEQELKKVQPFASDSGYLERYPDWFMEDPLRRGIATYAIHNNVKIPSVFEYKVEDLRRQLGLVYHSGCNAREEGEELENERLQQDYDSLGVELIRASNKLQLFRGKFPLCAHVEELKEPISKYGEEEFWPRLYRAEQIILHLLLFHDVEWIFGGRDYFTRLADQKYEQENKSH